MVLCQQDWHGGISGAFAEAWGAPVVVGHENVGRRLDRYELTDVIGPEHIFPTVGAAEEAFRARSNA